MFNVRLCVIYVSVCYSFCFFIFPELIFAMPSIASREMDALVTPFGPCDVSILSYFYIILYYYFYSIV
jgi:hypothetical protein